MSALLVIAVFGLFLVQGVNKDQVSGLDYPAQSGARLAERHLAFFEGIETVPAWQRLLFSQLFGEHTDSQREANGR